VQPCCSAKVITITCYKCVSVASGIQHAMPMRHIVIGGLSSCTMIFSHYLINGRIFRKKEVIEQKLCFDFMYNFEKVLIVKKMGRSVVINVHRSSCKLPFVLVRF
jgi:hypothetical protein